jgi:hypothetical protein
VRVLCAQDLLTEGLIKSGHDVLRVERKNQTFFGNLNEDGTIDFSSTVVFHMFALKDLCILFV